MANNSDLVAMGFTPQEIARVEALSQARRSGGMYDSAWTRQQNAHNTSNEAAVRREKAIKEILDSKGGGGGAGNTASQSNSSSFSGLEGTERDQIKGLLSQMIGGGTDAYKQAQAQRQETIGMLDSALGQYSKQAAFSDAAAMMQQNLNKSMEANQPAIQRAMQNAGTSGGSMQALLSQKLASEAALAAGTLGAEQAKAYGQISSSFMNQRGALTTGQDQSLDPITKLAELLKVSRSSGSSTGYFDPLRESMAAADRESREKIASMAASAAGPVKVHSTYGGPPLTDMVAGTGIGYGVSDAELAATRKMWADMDAKKEAERQAYKASLDARNAAYATSVSKQPVSSGMSYADGNNDKAYYGY